MPDGSGGLRIVLVGPPGAGKGTQADAIAKRARVPHIATGDMLRGAMRDGTPVGRRVREIVERGELVPDDLMGELVRERLSKDDTRAGFLLDGFPRTAEQARFLDRLLSERGEAIDRVVALEAPEAEIVDRLSGRRFCPDCGANYHVRHRKPRDEGRCDVCGGALRQRPDDAPETVAARLRVYAAQTAPVLEHYRAAGLLLTIDATGRPEEVLARIAAAVPGIPG